MGRKSFLRGGKYIPCTDSTRRIQRGILPDTYSRHPHNAYSSCERRGEMAKYEYIWILIFATNIDKGQKRTQI